MNKGYKLFLKLSEFSIEKGISRIVDTSEFKDEYINLKLGNGGSWCRLDSTFAKKYKYVLRKADGTFGFSWDIEDIEKDTIEQDFNTIDKKVGNKSITHIKVYGNKNCISNLNRSIRKEIKEYFKNYNCVVCGNSDIEIDHKNGLYNDSRVLNTQTQTISDFQPLCRHCNQQKRQSMILTKKTGKRYKATLIPQLKIFGVDFISGNEDYDPNDINAMIGTYWYDPIEFMKYIYSFLKIKNDI